MYNNRKNTGRWCPQPQYTPHRLRIEITLEWVLVTLLVLDVVLLVYVLLKPM